MGFFHVVKPIAIGLTAALSLAGCMRAPAPPSQLPGTLPVGGPEGYRAAPIIDDRFGSNRPDANITSLSQFNTSFNPATVYGYEGRGWDAYEKNWDRGPANIRMAADHLELRPGGTKLSAFIVSHFEFLPSGAERIYYEARVAIGRGRYGPTHDPNGSPKYSWPGIWMFAGNESRSVNARAEFDVNEQFYNIDTPTGTVFRCHAYDPGATDVEGYHIHVDNDITVNYNVYGWEVWEQNRRMFWRIYVNGAPTKDGYARTGINWTSTPPAVLVGWNPGASGQTDGTDVIKLDYFRVWRLHARQ